MSGSKPGNLVYHTDLQNLINTELAVLIGDLNAWHKELGDPTANTNGRRFISPLEAYDDVQIISKTHPTHFYGWTLDRCIGFTLSYKKHYSDIVDLMSD